MWPTRQGETVGDQAATPFAELVSPGVPAGEVVGEVVVQGAGADLQEDAARQLPSSAWARLKGRLVGIAAVAVPRVVIRGRGPRVPRLGWRRGRSGKGRSVGLVLQG